MLPPSSSPHSLNQLQQPPWSVGGSSPTMSPANIAAMNNLTQQQFHQQSHMMSSIQQQQMHHLHQQQVSPNINMRIQPIQSQSPMQQQQSQSSTSTSGQHHQMPPPGSSPLINPSQQASGMMMLQSQQQQQLIPPPQSPIPSQQIVGAPLPSPSQQTAPRSHQHHHHHHHHQQQSQHQQTQQIVQQPPHPPQSSQQSSQPSQVAASPSSQLQTSSSTPIHSSHHQHPMHPSFHPTQLHNTSHMGTTGSQPFPHIYQPSSNLPPHSNNQSQPHLYHYLNVNSLPLHMQPDFRIYEMNKRMANRPEQDFNDSSIWWDSFVNEFFEDDAKLSIRNINDENVSKNFTIGRTLIPRFFRSIYDGGVTDLYFHLIRGQINIIPKESTSASSSQHSTSPQNSILLFESDMCTMTTKYGRPMYAIILTEGQFWVEFNLNHSNISNTNDQINHQSFSPNDHNNVPIRIRNWIFSIRRHQELVPRSTIAIQQDQQGIEQLSKNITRTGLPNHTLNYLKLCSVLEPMQEIMIRSKLNLMQPRECLKACVTQRINSRMAIMNSGQPPTGLLPPGHPQNHHRISLISNDDLVPIKIENSNSFNSTKLTQNLLNAQQQQQQLQQPLVSGTSNQSPSSSSASSSQNNSASSNTDTKTPSKRRKRKPSTGSATPNTVEIKKESGPGSASKSKKANAEAKAASAAAVVGSIQTNNLQNHHQLFNLNISSSHITSSSISGDVMIVGEPSLMGGDFGEEDERLITRLENNQYDLNNINIMSSNPIQQQQIQHLQHMNLQRNNIQVNSNHSNFQQMAHQLVDDKQHQMQLVQQHQLQYQQQFQNNLSASPTNQLQLNDITPQQHPTRPPSLQSQLSSTSSLPTPQSSLSLPLPPRPQSSSHLSLINNPNQILEQQAILNNTASNCTSVGNRVSTPSPSTPNSSSISLGNNSNIALSTNNSNPNNSTSMTTPSTPPTLSHPPASLTPNILSQQATPNVGTSIQNGSYPNSSNSNNTSNNRNNHSISMSNSPSSNNQIVVDLNINGNGGAPSTASLSTSTNPNTNNNLNGIIGLNQSQQQPSTSSSSIASSSSSSPTLFSSIQSLNNQQQQLVLGAANSSSASNSTGSIGITNCSPPSQMINNNGSNNSSNNNNNTNNKSADVQQQQTQSITLSNY